MPLRERPMTLAERVAFIEEQLRGVHASIATTPVITDYSALQGVPTDFVTIAELNATLAPLAAEAALGADAAMLAYLMDGD